MKRPAVLVIASTLAVASCAYFNALYNAKRHFEDARRAEARGDLGTARFAYGNSIEKAAKSLRQSPHGRWADDALYLIGRAHFGRGDHLQARAALLRVLDESDDRDILAGARAYLGAIELRLGNPAAALQYLDAAAAELDRGEMMAFSRLWRARARFGTGDVGGAWSDLDRAVSARSWLARHAHLEAAAMALETDEPIRAERAFQALFQDRDASQLADTLRSLAQSARRRWGAETARGLLAHAGDSNWALDRRERLILFGAELAASSGDTAQAMAEARALADRAQGPTADMARIAYARWRLAAAEDLAELEDVRTALLPAIGSVEARDLVRNIAVMATLIARAQAGQHVAFFAAAELARDELGSPGLARPLFLAYADTDPESAWAAKALLAAAALDPGPAEAAAIHERLEAAYVNSVYMIALRGADPGDQFELLEDRLARVLTSVVATAAREAEGQEVAVAQAANVIDSLRAAARADSVAAACNIFVDSLGVRGIRADTVRAACRREEYARLDSLLHVDTLLLLARDSVDAAADTVPDVVFPDTVPGPS